MTHCWHLSDAITSHRRQEDGFKRGSAPPIFFNYDFGSKNGSRVIHSNQLSRTETCHFKEIGSLAIIFRELEIKHIILEAREDAKNKTVGVGWGRGWVGRGDRG